MIHPAVEFKLVLTPEGFQHDTGLSDEEMESFKKTFKRAEEYIRSRSWCKKVYEYYYGLGLDKIYGVFLFRIKSRDDAIGEWVWVIAGDIPPASLAGSSYNTPIEVLERYILEMERWCQAVKAGESLDGIAQVNAPPTIEWAGRLESRIRFIKERLLQR